MKEKKCITNVSCLLFLIIATLESLSRDRQCLKMFPFLPQQISSSQPKSVTVLRPNRQSSDRENGATPSSSSAIVSGGGAGIDGAGDIGSSSIGGGSSSSSAFAAIARGAGSTSGWRKQGLGSAVPAPGLKPTVAVPVVPSGDENAFPALPSKSLLADPQQQQPLQQPPQQQQQRGSDSPKIIAGSVPTSISVKYAGRPVDKPTAAAAPSAVKTAPTLATAPVDYARKLMPIPKMMDRYAVWLVNGYRL